MSAAFKREEILWAVEKSSNQRCRVCLHACCRSQQKVVGSWWWVLEGKINMKEISKFLNLVLAPLLWSQNVQFLNSSKLEKL